MAEAIEGKRVVDAGAESDAGRDASTVTTDASIADGGVVTADAGRNEDASSTPASSGGCATAPSATSFLPATVLLALQLLAFRRRPRR